MHELYRQIKFVTFTIQIQGFWIHHHHNISVGDRILLVSGPDVWIHRDHAIHCQLRILYFRPRLLKFFYESPDILFNHVLHFWLIIYYDIFTKHPNTNFWIILLCQILYAFLFSGTICSSSFDVLDTVQISNQ